MKRDSAVFGIAAALLCWFTVTLGGSYVENWQYRELYRSYYGFESPMGQEVQYLPIVGMFQPLYLLPASFVLRRFGYSRFANGLFWTTITVLVPSAILVIAYVVILSSMPRIG